MAVGVSDFPTNLDTASDLIEAANKSLSTLASGINNSTTTLPLVSASTFTTSGVVSVGNEIISYTGKTGDDLTGCVRGFESTSAASHSAGAVVRQLITARSHNVLAGAIISLQTKLGTGSKIALARLTDVTASRLLGRGSAAGTGSAEEITLGTGLTMSGTTLSSSAGVTDGDKGDITVGSSGASWTVNSDAVTFDKTQNIDSMRVLGRTTASAGDIEQLTVGQGLTLANGELRGGREILTGDRTYHIGFAPGTAGTGACTFTNASPSVVTCNGHGLLLDDPIVFSSSGTLPVTNRSGNVTPTNKTFTSAGTVASPSPTLTSNSHGFQNNQIVALSTTGTLPAGLSTNTTYVVRNAATNTFQLASSAAGNVINTTSSGTGTHTVNETVNPSRIYYARDIQTNTFKLAKAIDGPAISADFTRSSHGISLNEPVVFTLTSSIPTSVNVAIEPGRVHYVSSVVSANEFQFSYTIGGASINTGSTGSGTHHVRTGNDSNIGYGTNSRTVAKLTINSAINDVIANVDVAGYNVDLQLVPNNEYADGVRFAGWVGGGNLRLLTNGGHIQAANQNVDAVTASGALSGQLFVANNHASLTSDISSKGGGGINNVAIGILNIVSGLPGSLGPSKIRFRDCHGGGTVDGSGNMIAVGGSGSRVAFPRDCVIVMRGDAPSTSFHFANCFVTNGPGVSFFFNQPVAGDSGNTNYGIEVEANVQVANSFLNCAYQSYLYFNRLISYASGVSITAANKFIVLGALCVIAQPARNAISPYFTRIPGTGTPTFVLTDATTPAMATAYHITNSGGILAG